MIVAVNSENEKIWAELCVELWPENTIEKMLNELHYNKLPNEYLYYLKDEAIAFMSLSIRNDYVEGTNSHPVAYLEGIYVKPNFRKKGIAKEFIQFAKEWARNNKCKELASDCELSNEISRTFHNKVGFEEANVIVCFKMNC